MIAEEARATAVDLIEEALVLATDLGDRIEDGYDAGEVTSQDVAEARAMLWEAQKRLDPERRPRRRS